jgi:hypothetical protein
MTALIQRMLLWSSICFLFFSFQISKLNLLLLFQTSGSCLEDKSCYNILFQCDFCCSQLPACLRLLSHRFFFRNQHTIQNQFSFNNNSFSMTGIRVISGTFRLFSDFSLVNLQICSNQTKYVLNAAASFLRTEMIKGAEYPNVKYTAVMKWCSNTIYTNWTT